MNFQICQNAQTNLQNNDLKDVVLLNIELLRKLDVNIKFNFNSKNHLNLNSIMNKLTEYVLIYLKTYRKYKGKSSKNA